MLNVKKIIKNSTFSRLSALLDHQTWRSLIILGFWMIVSRAIFSFAPLLYSQIIDALTKPNAALIPVWLILGYVFVRFISSAFRALTEYYFAHWWELLSKKISIKMFEHIHRLPYQFHAQSSSGSLSDRVSNGMQALEYFSYSLFYGIIPIICECIFTFFLFIYFIPGIISALLIITIAIYLIIMVLTTNTILETYSELREKQSKIQATFIERLINFELIAYFNTLPYEMTQLEGMHDIKSKSAIHAVKKLSLIRTVQDALMYSLIGFHLLILSSYFYKGLLSIGQCVMVITYLFQLFDAITSFAYSFHQSAKQIVSVNTMLSLLDEPIDTHDQTLPNLPITAGTIDFKDISFHYPDKPIILDHLSLHISSSSTIALVGSTGAGKTTLVKLLTGLYKPQSGHILIDGHDITNYNKESLRASIGIVPQDAILFNDTILFNLTYGSPQASMADVIKATQLAQLHDFIMEQPDGYQTMVGQRGISISGGERQRLAIARALLRNPKILIFDESTSSLDVITEKAIMQEFEKIRQGRTTIIIAHRLSTVIHADKIVVLKHGKIVQMGTHAELMSQEGEYLDLWRNTGVLS